MRRTQLVAALLVCAVISAPRAGSAQNAPPPTILNVTMDAAGDQLTISGTGFGPAPVVTIDGQPVPVLLGSTDTQVTVITPSVLLTTPGTYRLTVVDSVRQVGEVFVVASHAGIVAPVGGIPSETPTVATGGARRLAAPTAAGPTGTAVAQPLNGVGLLIVEDSGSPFTTALGYQAAVNTTGTNNTATGYQALTANTTGGSNTATGYHALTANTTGVSNTANGILALVSNTTGGFNTASGAFALRNNTTGGLNTASGGFALIGNTTGGLNTADGYDALAANTMGSANTASGLDALTSNTTGSYNTASGLDALYSNTTGNHNTALGYNAGYSATTGNYNLFLGADLRGMAADTNTIRIGLPYDGTNGQNQIFVAGIYGTPITGGLPVVINANGQLGIAALPVTFIGPPGGSGTEPPAMVAQLQQQVQDQQTTIADLSARLARLEALVGSSAGGK
jgi:hypothetical protein